MAYLRSFRNYYAAAMNKHPWRTTAVVTGILCGTGDVIAQQVVEKCGIQNHNVRRTLKLTAMGAVLIGPALRMWYVILDKLVKGTSSAAALKKMLLDQGIWAPCFIAAFFTVADALDRKSVIEIQQKLKNAYFPALKVNYVIWPWVQLANFYLVPLQHRVVVVNFVALFWNTYLAWAVNKQIDEEEIA